MIFLKLLLLLTLSLPALASETLRPSCSLDDGLSIGCYFKRDKPILRAALLYYGTYWDDADLDRFKGVFTNRFNQATRGEVTIKIVSTKILPFRRPLPVGYSYNGITDPERLHRIWYWQFINTGLGQELLQEYVRGERRTDLQGLDLLLTLTGAQADGNGYSAGGVVVIEQPREIAWGLPDQGSTEELSDHQAADILTHEVGHAIGIGHANDQCSDPKLSHREQLECCANSPSRNDVMGYCRNRTREEVNTFEACTLEIIKSKIRPRILGGGRRRIEEVIRCR